ncbi:MAG: hypothetical protein WBP61_19405 [Nocardioides sp.]
MPILHVTTVHPDLPIALIDHLLACIEHALQTAGASRIWIDEGLPPLSVMAELPADAVPLRPSHLVAGDPR